MNVVCDTEGHVWPDKWLVYDRQHKYRVCQRPGCYHMEKRKVA